MHLFMHLRQSNTYICGNIYLSSFLSQKHDLILLMELCHVFVYLWDIMYHFEIDFLSLYDEIVTFFLNNSKVFSIRDMKSPVKSCSNRNWSFVCTWNIRNIIWNYLIISFERVEYYSRNRNNIFNKEKEIRNKIFNKNRNKKH